MFANRLLRVSSRSKCHLTLLNASAGLENQSARGVTKYLQNNRSPSSQHIRFSSQFQGSGEFNLSEAQQRLADELANEVNDEDIEAESNALDEAFDESLPWYLQDQAPTPPIRPLSERQQLPELPGDAPPILEPMVNKISIDLGLDELSLLDLRKLDPPPALGANLIMLIGTARSERHLHVSADRLCRWLRTEYHLRPDADGLLGRAELKLKLKRKARRQKLTGDGTIDENADDGIRTGWVCINVGTVESAASAESPPADTNFVGFGRRTEGTKIVVQMLTEEKRNELDLEHLWGGIVRRNEPQFGEESST